MAEVDRVLRAAPLLVALARLGAKLVGNASVPLGRERHAPNSNSSLEDGKAKRLDSASPVATPR